MRDAEWPEHGPHAAVFDLDGVITFTAVLHAAAWKRLFDQYLSERAQRGQEPFEPFTDDDYRSHVDGRPRHDGIRTFLDSRGITVPDGEASDPPGAETVHGLGNRKNELFRQMLEADGLEVDDAAVRFVRELRASGVMVGVATSSRNATLVLERAGLEDLFQTRVDGSVSADLGLAGKPAADIFLECLKRLGNVEPDLALVVEDALAGVEAGRAGGFGLVLGVDRGAGAVPLREHGADWVIEDFREISAGKVVSFFAGRVDLRPNVLADWESFHRAIAGRRLAIFLDYDGTLTPIVDRPDLAVLDDDMCETLHRLTAAWPTTIVSGRGREDVHALVGIDGLVYAGSHGFDIEGPGGLRLEVDPELPPLVAAAAEEVRSRTSEIPGVLVEDKRFAVAVHYRRTPEHLVEGVERAVDETLADRSNLRKSHGKKVFELRSSREWDKGRAVRWLLDTLPLDGGSVLPIYVGDDVTDEDAFHALEDDGLGILVSELPRPTAARWSVQDIREVRELLDRLASDVAGPPG